MIPSRTIEQHVQSQWPATASSAASDEVTTIARRLLAYCEANEWAGYDPYDALNSRILKALPLLDARVPRLVLTQLLKRSPVNVRPLLLVPPTRNPKAIALFLSAALKLERAQLLDRPGLIDDFVDTLIALRSPQTPYWCWGYSFPWQTRTIVVPRGAPNLVCTIFVGNALLDAYDQHRDARCLSMAISASDYLMKELYWSKDVAVAGFSYPLPSVRSPIHNANLLGAAFVSRVAAVTGDAKYLPAARRAALASATAQREDGSWTYGETPTQRWVDSFHTGFNLRALAELRTHLQTDEFDGYLERGLDFYRRHFFREDGAVRYFHDQTFPIDAHAIADSMITLLALRDRNPDNVILANRAADWARTHMWDSQGYFYYRKLRFFTIKTSYMRWTQAWMLLAWSTLIVERYGDVQRQTITVPE